jgi:hypothetical protein
MGCSALLPDAQQVPGDLLVDSKWKAGELSSSSTVNSPPTSQPLFQLIEIGGGSGPAVGGEHPGPGSGLRR